MGKRELLIAYAVKYDGDYFKILKAIKNNERIEEIKKDNCLTILDDDYPRKLLDLKYPPLVLFYKGNIEFLHRSMVAIVGSRIPCEYSISATKALAQNLKEDVIVSGLAKGIDAVAHQNSNISIGVLGCGIDYIYPYENIELYAKLEKNGLIISEYPDRVKPINYHFPFRNRIIAALANKIYVMQSSEKSGTVTTINEALELGKDVYVLPFSVFEDEGIYNNKLINDGALLIETKDINT